MKKELLYFAALGLFLCFTAKAQEAQRNADNIIEKSRKAVFKQNVNIKSFYLESVGDFRSNKERVSKGYVDYKYQAKLWFEDSPKMKLRILATYPNNQQESIERIFNNADFSETNRIKTDSGGFTEMTLIPKGDLQKIKEEKISKLKFGTFSTIFPILFKFDNSLKFNFVGVAKAGEQKADVIETTIAVNYKIKLFLDKETYLPLLMTANFYDDILKKDIEQKFFYSDFKEENGLLYAHKIIIQENNEVVEEREIKLVILNPQLKTDFFEIKK